MQPTLVQVSRASVGAHVYEKRLSLLVRKLFPVQNGASLTVTGAGVSWINNMEVDGGIVVSPPTLNFTNLGGTNLQFSWSGGFKLQSQTNNLSVGIGTNWSDYPGGGSSGATVPIDATNGTVFFRLVSP